MSQSEQVLSHTICRNLSDRSYEKRKQGALAIEQLVRQLNNTTENVNNNKELGNTDKKKEKNISIEKTINFLVQTFIRSTQANHRKGGLIGLAGVALGLNRDTCLYLNVMLPAVCSLLQDQEARVRYYACESLYNISKVARENILEHFDRIFEGLCTLLEDPDSNVKEAASLLDRLIKEIVTRSGDQFNLKLFIPLLKTYMNNQNPYVRELLLQWIILLNNTPGIELLEYLPQFLDGLFKMLQDDKNEIVKQTEIVLTDFLREISSSVHIDLHPMVHILVLQIKNQSHSENRRLFGLIWLYEFLKLGQFKLSIFFPNILVSLLQCVRDDEEENIRLQANKTNNELYELIKSYNNHKGIDDNNKKKSDENLSKDLMVYELLEILRGACKSDYVKTKIAALNFICMMLIHLNLNINNIEKEKNLKLFPVLLDLLCDRDNQVVELTLRVLSQISIKPQYFDQILINLLKVFKTRKNLLAIRGKFIIEKLCELLDSQKIYKAMAQFLITYVDDNKHENNQDNEENKDDDDNNNNDLEFCSLMIQSLNIILLTADSVYIQNLRDLVQNDTKLFLSLYSAWCYDPISTLSLCLMAKMYELGAKLIIYFANIDITIGFLMQVDKLVTLIESPTFVHLRLELLEPYKNPYLLKIMYGLLMLLPQNNAFNSLRIRLQSASSFGLLQDENININNNNNNNKNKKQKRKDHNNNKTDVNIDKLFEKFVNVQQKFKKQRLRNQEALKIKNHNNFE